MTTYAVDITITDEETGKEVLHVCVTREHVAAALHAATQGADTMLGALAVGIPIPETPKHILTDRAYCLTHDLMWNAKGHDAQAWCSTREATQQEVDEADLSVEDREFTKEPLEIEQMEQRVIGVDLVEGKPPTIVEGTYSDGVLHIGVPRGTDPNALGRIVEAEIAKGNVEPQGVIQSLPKETQAARASDLGQMLRDGIIYRHPEGDDDVKPARSPGQALIDRMVQENLRAEERRGSLSEGEHRVYGAGE